MSAGVLAAEVAGIEVAMASSKSLLSGKSPIGATIVRIGGDGKSRPFCEAADPERDYRFRDGLIRGSRRRKRELNPGEGSIFACIAHITDGLR